MGNKQGKKNKEKKTNQDKNSVDDKTLSNNNSKVSGNSSNNNQILIDPKDSKEIITSFEGGSLYQDIRKLYKFKDVLGGGHFGTVRISYKRNEEPRKYYAVKSISKKNLTEKDLKELIKEVEIISNLDHPNIIKFFETYHDEYYFHIVMELCKGKEVFDKIVQEDFLTEQKVAKIVYKVLSAVHYCHTNGISHRDIKPENILFESTDPDSDIKIIDFGLSRKYNSEEKMHTILGTPYYVAPEVLKGNYDEKCDVWSLGAITFIMLCGEPPFIGKTNSEIFKKILNEDISFGNSKWKKISNEAKNFIKSCMEKNADKRFSAKEAFSHPWFKSINEEVNSAQLDSDILNNIKNFSSPENFKKLILKYMINFLSSKEIKNLKKVFYAIDKDHTGKININELDKAFKESNIEVDEEELKKIISYTEAQDGSGKIEYTDFIVASLNQKDFIDKERLITAFKYFDIDSSGYIDSSDVKKALLRSGKKFTDQNDVDKMIDEVTAEDKKFKVSLDEFLKLFDVDLEIEDKEDKNNNENK